VKGDKLIPKVIEERKDTHNHFSLIQPEAKQTKLKDKDILMLN
jgi:hypothetical protein